MSLAQLCRYTKVQPYAQQNPDQNGEMMDIEDLNRLGRVRGPCPFYLSREMAATANIIFMPYNYLVDPKIRGGLQTQWQNSVLIFDEAHNIEVPSCKALTYLDVSVPPAACSDCLHRPIPADSIKSAQGCPVLCGSHI